MAKSARASVRKRNNAALRAKVFGPAHDARTQRLSAKLQELVAKPRPDGERAMDVDENVVAPEDVEQDKDDQKEDEDVQMKGVPTTRRSSKKPRSGRIEKRESKRKPRNRVVFPTSEAKRKRIAQSKKKSI